MAREAYQNSGGTATLSSIALLQERFRQLQKMKEMRQEKELIKILSEPDRYTTPPVVHPKTIFVSADPIPIHVPEPHCQLTLSLSLWPAEYSSDTKKQGNSKSFDEPALINLRKPTWFGGHDLPSSVLGSPIKLETCLPADIDTSLHL